MTDYNLNPDEANEGDILFECEHCGKSLAIDPRGAGLTVVCPDCGKETRVPTLEDTEEQTLVVAEPAGEDHDGRMGKLTDSLAAAQAKIGRLVETIEELRERRNHLERLRSDNMARFERVSAELTVIQSAMDRLVELVADARDEDRQPT